MSTKRSDRYEVSNDQDYVQPPAILPGEDETCHQSTFDIEIGDSTEDETIAIDDLGGHQIDDSDFDTQHIPRITQKLTPPKQVEVEDCMPLECSKGSGTSDNTNSISESHMQSEAVVSTASDRFARYPDPEKDISRVLKSYRRLHDRFVEIRLRLEVLPQRYLIVVVPEGRTPSRVNVDKHLILFRGNRLTTIETIRRMYSVSTASEDFGFLLGQMAVTDADRMEQLDFFQSKVVVLRCVSQQESTLLTRQLVDGVLLQAKKPLASTEVIEID